jgi:hypothetical protein
MSREQMEAFRAEARRRTRGRALSEDEVRALCAERGCCPPRRLPSHARRSGTVVYAGDGVKHLVTLGEDVLVYGPLGVRTLPFSASS